jgi:hypothetical protein
LYTTRKPRATLMKIYLVRIACVLFIISNIVCSQKNDNETNIKYSIKFFDRTYTTPDTTLKGSARVFFEYPGITKAYSQYVKDSISKYIYKSFLGNYCEDNNCKSLEEMADSLFRDFKSFKNEFPDSPQSWEIKGTTSVIYNSHSIVSLQTDYYSYLGGAHPNELVLYANFNSEDGRRINLSDLFRKETKNKLINAAEKIFRKIKKLKPEDDLQADGFWFKDNMFKLNENFGIKNDGLVFYFNSYEIAPHAMGPTEIIIPYYEIKTLIEQNGILSKAAADSN